MKTKAASKKASKKSSKKKTEKKVATRNDSDIEFSFESLKNSLEDALAFVDGKDVSVRIHKVESFVETEPVKRKDVQEFRKKHGLSLQSMADLFSVSIDTVKSWERRSPGSNISGSTKRLFQIFNREPRLIEELKAEFRKGG
jgi:DNA-binding transcriptional regulator YiaG